MESASKFSDNLEEIKEKIDNLKFPSEQNLKSIHDILELYDRSTAALLNPIKKLKISYNMRINSFKGKYENFLGSLKSKISSLEKNKNPKELKNLDNAFVEETLMKSNELNKEHGKLTKLLEECLESIGTLNSLFDTEEFRKLDGITKNLNASRKKQRPQSSELNKDDKSKSSDSRLETLQNHTVKRNSSKSKSFNQNGRSLGKLLGKKRNPSKTGQENLDNNRNNETRIISSSKNNKKKTSAKKPISNGNGNNSKNKTSKNTQLGQQNSENSDDENDNKQDDSKLRKLSDEECLEKMKLEFPEDKSLTKTFITRKLKKRIMIFRLLNFSEEETYKGVENTIPKKTGPNSYIKFTIEIKNKEQFSLNSPLMYFVRELFHSYFIIFKEKDSKIKIVIAGNIQKDIVTFLKKIANDEFKNKYSVKTAKVKAYAFYEELIYEFSRKENIAYKQINEADLKGYVDLYNYLEKLRQSYEEIRKIRVEN